MYTQKDRKIIETRHRKFLIGGDAQTQAYLLFVFNFSLFIGYQPNFWGIFFSFYIFKLHFLFYMKNHMLSQ